MKTKCALLNEDSIAEAAALLCAGEIVAFPTETVYGLGADALQPAAVAKIFAAKGRPADNPLIAHIGERAMGDEIAIFTPLAEKLAAAFWPGPLTLVLPRRAVVPDIVTAGLDTVGVRFPAHPGALALLRATGRPVAAPSANLSGRPSPTLASHVYEDLAGRIPLILDGGPVTIGLESTVVDATGSLPVLLRPGRVTMEQLAALCGGCLFPGKGASARPAAPGMKYRHYAPKGELILAADWRQADAARCQLLAKGEQPLLLLTDATADALRLRGMAEAECIRLGKNEEEFAARLFAALREADARGARHIVAESAADAGLGRAIQNRLAKAAGKSDQQGEKG